MEDANNSLEESGRSPHGERGLKSNEEDATVYRMVGRSPHGERGLKYTQELRIVSLLKSLSSRRAWIEIM